MFARRHPLLYFCLVAMVICSVTLVVLLSVVVGGGALLRSAVGNDTGRGNVGIVEIGGVITSSRQVIDHIQRFREDPDIKAIILRINSPGGGVGPSQEIYREVMKTRTVKKVIASLGSVAASGGYYSAAACDGIIANPGTITGSIGVIMEYASVKEVIEKIGLSPVVIKSGEFKDMGSPLRDIRDKEKKLLQAMVDEIHDQFVRDVARGRRLDPESLESLADGRIFTGAKALEFQLVDRLGNLGDAVEWAGIMADISGEAVPVYPSEDGMDRFRKLITSLLKNVNITGTVADNFGFVIQ